jgi:hypothetical protein
MCCVIFQQKWRGLIISSFISEFSNEVQLSKHSDAQWKSRERELSEWMDRPKLRKQVKRTLWLTHTHVDAELHPALTMLQKKGIRTEFSCAGVSPLDEPIDHSLYAYITLSESSEAQAWVDFVMKVMKHRLLVTYEPGRSRYDLSSFFISHNRSFCLLMQRCAAQFQYQPNPNYMTTGKEL